MFWNKNHEQYQDFIKALQIIWYIISVIILAILVLTISQSSQTALNLAPTCSLKAQGLECFLCGTTRAFIKISHFEFTQAYTLNKISIPLYIAFLINTIIFLQKLIITIYKYLK